MARRRKGYAQLSNGFFEDTKIRKAMKRNPRAGLLFVMSISFSSSNLTDGHISLDDAEYVLNADEADIRWLVAEGLWIEDGEGWSIHNYLKYNVSRDRVLAELERDNSRKSSPSDDSGRIPDGFRTEKVRIPDGFRTDVNKEQRTNNKEQITTSCCCSSIESTNRARENENNNNEDIPPAPTPIPADWTPDETDAAYAIRYLLDPHKTGRAFRDYHLRHGTTSCDWHAMFRGWCQRNPDGKPPPDDR